MALLLLCRLAWYRRFDTTIRLDGRKSSKVEKIVSVSFVLFAHVLYHYVFGRR